MSEGEESSLLVVLLETHPNLWSRLPVQASSPHQLTASAFLEQVLSFLQAFLLVNDANRLAAFSVHASSSQLLYMSPGLLASSGVRRQDTNSEPLAKQIVARLRTQMQQQPHSGCDGQPAVAGALSRALCFIQRLWGGGWGLDGDSRNPQIKAQRVGKAPPRILCLAASQDVASQYMPAMNAIFAAQKMGAAVDACMVGGCDSAFLQQASFITGGIYLRPTRPAALLQYLLTTLLADVNTRKLLKQPPNAGVDFSASCFCHRKPIDLGYVCSVCLSIFCEEVDECSTCGTNFKSGSTRVIAGS